MWDFDLYWAGLKIGLMSVRYPIIEKLRYHKTSRHPADKCACGGWVRMKGTAMDLVQMIKEFVGAVSVFSRELKSQRQ